MLENNDVTAKKLRSTECEMATPLFHNFIGLNVKIQRLRKISNCRYSSFPYG